MRISLFFFHNRGKVLKSEKLVLFVGNVFFFIMLIFILGVHAARYYKLWEEEGKARDYYVILRLIVFQSRHMINTLNLYNISLHR